MTAPQREKTLKAACKSMYTQIYSTWGRGWFRLSEDLKHALIAEVVFHVFASRPPEETVTAGIMQEYLQAMRNYCCLGDETTEENVSR